MSKVCTELALRREFETFQMKDGESIMSYCGGVMKISNKMRIYGEKMKDATIIDKILHKRIPKFDCMLCSIEESKDMNSLSIDELQSPLLVHVQKINKSRIVEEQALIGPTISEDLIEVEVEVEDEEIIEVKILARISKPIITNLKENAEVKLMIKLR